MSGGAFSNPKRDFYRARLVLARHLFAILCQEISELVVTAIAAPAMSSALRYVERHSEREPTLRPVMEPRFWYESTSQRIWTGKPEIAE